MLLKDRSYTERLDGYNYDMKDFLRRTEKNV